MGQASNSSAPIFDQARDELFSHILRCGVIDATVDHKKDWFDDTMEYLADRYLGLSDEKLDDLRALGERYCRPVIMRAAPADAVQEAEVPADEEVAEALPEDAETAVVAG